MFSKLTSIKQKIVD